MPHSSCCCISQSPEADLCIPLPSSFQSTAGQKPAYPPYVPLCLSFPPRPLSFSSHNLIVLVSPDFILILLSSHSHQHIKIHSIITVPSSLKQWALHKYLFCGVRDVKYLPFSVKPCITLIQDKEFTPTHKTFMQMS